MVSNDIANKQPAPPAMSSVNARRATIAGFFGSFVEFYDFMMYGLMAVFFAPYFFPAGDAAASTLTALLVFAGGYLARPFGAILFGHIGDRYGRRGALMATVSLMGLSCLIIGLTPTHQTIGVWAPILVVIARLAQGLAAGGELMGALTFVVESAPTARRGLFASLTPMGSSVGVATASMVSGIVGALLTDQELASWGWRLMFLTAVPPALITVWMRKRLQDSPEFVEMTKQEIKRLPLLDTFRAHRRQVLTTIGLCFGVTATTGLYPYFTVYLVGSRHFPAQQVFWMAAIVGFLQAGMQPISGRLSDRLGRKPVMIVSFAVLALLGFPVFLMLGNATNIVLIGLVLVFFQGAAGIATVTVSTVATELFPRAVRYSGAGFSAQVGTAIASGFAPYVAAQLVLLLGIAIAPAFWVIIGVVVGFVAIVFVKETARQTLLR